MKDIYSLLTKNEKLRFDRFNTPQKIQDYLDTLPINFEHNGETLHSPRSVMRHGTAHCFEGALFACAVGMYHGFEVALLDLEAGFADDAHVVCIFKQNKKWGAISKTNHAALTYRDPVYASVRELVMSYFHEYFLNRTGKKTLRRYAVLKPSTFQKDWITSDHSLWYINNLCDNAKKIEILNQTDIVCLRKATQIEVIAGSIVQWSDPKSSK